MVSLVKNSKMKREVLLMKNVFDGVNIANLIEVVKDPMTEQPAIIVEYANHVEGEYKVLFKTFNDFDIRYYMFEILKALEYTHSVGIAHRDVKPHNVVIDHPNRVLKLIDWGLAEFYHPGKEYNVKVASKNYKGPELLTEL